MRTFLLPGDGISLPGAVSAVVVWLIIAGGVAVLGWRAAVPAVTATGVAGLVAVVAGVVAADENPGVVVRARAAELLLGMVAGRLRDDRRDHRRVLAADGRRPSSRRVAMAAPSAARRRRRGRAVCRRLAALPGRFGGRRRGRGAARRPAAARPTGRGDRRWCRSGPRRSRLVAGLLRQRPPVRHARRVAARRDRVRLRARAAATSTASASRDVSRRAVINACCSSPEPIPSWRPAR